MSMGTGTTENKGAASVSVKDDELVDELIITLLAKLFTPKKITYKGFRALKLDILEKIASHQPLKFILPAFPCKSVNIEKCMGVYPDLAEWLAIKRIVSTIRIIQELYEPGVSFVIFSDYHTFANYISVSQTTYREYFERLKEIIDTFQCGDALNLQSFSESVAFRSHHESNYPAVLSNGFGDPTYESRLTGEIKKGSGDHKKYTALKKFMKNDQWPLIKHLGKAARNRHLSKIAIGMMVQGQALDDFLSSHYLGFIRLSIHDHPFDGVKNPIRMFDTDVFKTPWHNAVMFDAQTGDFIIDKQCNLIKNAELTGGLVLNVQFKKIDWFLLKLTPRTPEQHERMRRLKVSISLHDCGLLIENTVNAVDIRDIDNTSITHLIKNFGIVVFRGFNSFDAVTDLEKWYATRGEPLQWSFGNTHLVRPDDDSAHPKSSVTSEEALPFHWDMVSPPPDMNIDQAIMSYKDFTPREFVLYCKYSTEDGQGLSTIINAAMVPLTMSGPIRKALRDTVLAYSTGLSYFGGVERTYPVIMKCPWTGNDVVRWWQSWTETEHPESTQHNYTTVSASTTYEHTDDVETLIAHHCLNASSYFTHEFMKGDIALFNNYTILHGRTSFKGHRELWRIQLSPPRLHG